MSRCSEVAVHRASVTLLRVSSLLTIIKLLGTAGALRCEDPGQGNGQQHKRLRGGLLAPARFPRVSRRPSICIAFDVPRR
eukprot:6205767-Pleurochrysis_carterae.AAC.2